MEQHSAPQTALRIGEVTLRHGLFLAPLAGVSDHPFRAICRRFGAEYTVSEIVSAQSLCYERMSKKASVGENSRTAPLACVHADDVPMAVQLFGRDPHFLSEAAKMIEDGSYAGCKSQAAPAAIDLNMGCPVPKVANNGDGSALMKDPDKAMKIVEAVGRAAGCPVTVKTRKGWDKGSVNAVEFAQAMESAGAAAVAVHARTKTQMYAGRADWDILREVKKALRVPLIANGDVFEPEDVPHILRYTGADAVMIGRGAFGNPWLFQRGLAALQGEEVPPLPPLRERMEVALRQIELAKAQKGEKIACLEARKQYAWYLRGVSHSGYWKREITAITVMEDVYRITKGIQEELR
jgi:tRNA-dihydrouridine synthase B